MYSDTYGKQMVRNLNLNFFQPRGQQKLKLYCQMCRKQCKDENGFKCHVQSDSHISQMRLFNEDPDKFINLFSDEFETAFIMILKEKYRKSFYNKTFRFSNQRVEANQVYMDMIRNVEHVHMNGTKWTNLNQFCFVKIIPFKIFFYLKYLKDEGKIELEQGERGDMNIQLIDNSAEAVRKRKEQEKKKKLVTKQADQIDSYVLKQAQKGLLLKQSNQEVNQDVKQGEEEEEEKIQDNITVNFELKKTIETPKIQLQINSASDEQRKRWVEDNSQALKQPNLNFMLQKMKFNQVKEEEQSEQATNINDIPWVHEGIIVKVLDKKIKDGQLFGKKGLIKKTIDDFGAQLEMQTQEKEKLNMDQEFLETVIPQIGKQVMILKPGPYRGLIGSPMIYQLLLLGKLESVHRDNFSGSIYLEGIDKLVEMPYELFSKVME